LFLVGFLVESVIGKVFFLTNYLFSALAAIVVYLLTSNGSSLLGASGAVSGLMGIYTVIFGLRKIDLFYSFGFYFDRIRAPAILLLPIWLGTELYQYFYDKDSHIAYMAHFGGLICGATMGALYLGQKRALVEDNHAKAESQIVDKEIFEQGMDYLGKLEFKKALHVFKKLLEKHPDNINLIRLTYRAAKNDPSSEDYHRSALKFLSLPSKDTTVFDQKHSIFLEYMNCAKPAPKLNHEITVKLAKEFSAHSHSDDAEKLANWLQNNSPTHSELPEILLALARGFYRENRKEKFAEVINKIIQQYPNTTAAASATEMLRVG
jgi:outer membrane protein assembly factor BamD (BamD/ComL family)